MIHDLVGSIGLAAIVLGTIGLGALFPWPWAWPWGAGLLGVGIVLWAVWGR